MYWEATHSINKSVNGKSGLPFTIYKSLSAKLKPVDLNFSFKSKLWELEYAWVWQNLSFLSCWDLLHSCWLTGFLDVYLSTTLKLRPEFDFYMKLIYHTERATAELGYGRGMNAWAVATKGFYFHTFTQSLSLSIGLIIAMSLSTASKENTLLKLALNSF